MCHRAAPWRPGGMQGRVLHRTGACLDPPQQVDLRAPSRCSCKRMYKYVCIYMYTYISIHVYIYIYCIYVYRHVYTYICIHTLCMYLIYTHIIMYAHTQRANLLRHLLSEPQRLWRNDASTGTQPQFACLFLGQCFAPGCQQIPVITKRMGCCSTLKHGTMRSNRKQRTILIKRCSVRRGTTTTMLNALVGSQEGRSAVPKN